MIDQISELLFLIHLSTHILSHWNTSDCKDSPITTEITSCVFYNTSKNKVVKRRVEECMKGRLA